MNALSLFLNTANTLLACKNSWEMLSTSPIHSSGFLPVASVASASMEIFNTMCSLIGVNVPYFKIIQSTFYVIQIGLAHYKTLEQDKNREYSARMFCNALCISRLLTEMKGITSYGPQVQLPFEYTWHSLISFEAATRLYLSRKQLFPKKVPVGPTIEELQREDKCLLEGRFHEILEIPERYLTDHFRPAIPICPITQRLVRFPVIDPTCKKVFERDSLYQWVSDHKTSPITRKTLQPDQIQPCQNTEFWINFFLGCTQAYLKKKQELHLEKEVKTS